MLIQSIYMLLTTGNICEYSNQVTALGQQSKLQKTK